MAIQTKDSLSGFIASDPQLTFTGNGEARFYARIGQPHARREEDGSFTKLDPTFADLVMFRKSAELAHAQFQKGDNFIAEGDVQTYPQTVDGVEVEREQFVASRIGHDNNTTRYEVHRAPERGPVERESVSRDQVTDALAARQEALDPEPDATTVAATSRATLAR